MNTIKEGLGWPEEQRIRDGCIFSSAGSVNNSGRPESFSAHALKRDFATLLIS